MAHRPLSLAPKPAHTVDAVELAMHVYHFSAHLIVIFLRRDCLDPLIHPSEKVPDQVLVPGLVSELIQDLART